jgi:hypothetical protein
MVAMSQRPWVPFVAAGLALLLFGAAIGATPAAMPAFAVGGFAFAVALVVALKDRKDKYDLGMLRTLHERELVDSIEIPEPEEYDAVVCIHCGTAYSARFPTCPNCGQR